MKNKLFALLMVVVLAVSVMTVAAFAAEPWTPCANGCEFELNAYGRPVAAVAEVYPTCTTDGHGAIYACKNCGGLWDNAMGMGVAVDPAKLEDLLETVVWEADGYSHVVKHAEAKEANCTENGNIEYWFCEECDLVCTDEYMTEVSNFKSVVIAAGCKHNAEHYEAKEATCHGKGNKEFWYCENCDVHYADAECTEVVAYLSVVIPEKGSENLKHFEAVEATCHDDGNVEYWHCADCSMVWTDEALTQTSNLKSVIIPAKGTDKLVHVEAVKPGCHMNGCIEHWICNECGKVWTDKALTEVSNVKNVVIPAIGGEVKHVAAVAPACNEGNIEYWYCEECEQVWQDKALTQLTNQKNVKLAPVHEKEYFAAKEAVCHQAGNKEYWYCEECDVVYEKDDKGNFINSNRQNVVIPAEVELTQVAAKAAGCHTNGNIAYSFCEECGIMFDENGIVTNAKRVTILAENALVYTEGYLPTCCKTGLIENWYCAECDMYFTDKDGKYNIARKSLVVAPTNELTYTKGYEATCHQTGMLENWYCDECDTYYVLDDEGNMINTNAKSVIIPALKELVYVEAVKACHVDGNVEYWYCDDCDAIFVKDDKGNLVISNIKNVTLPATMELEHVKGVDPVCHQNGMKEHYYCAGCDVYFVKVDGNLMNVARLSLVVPAVEPLTHYEAVEATCSANGYQEYWYCAKCDAVFADAAATQLTNRKNLTIERLECKNIIHFEAVEPGCHSNGNIEYWYCSDCENYYQDEARVQLTNAKRVILPATGSDKLVHFEAVKPGCHSNGNIEYWFCPDCEGFFQDEACTQITNSKNVILPATGSENLVHFEAVKPGCHSNGNIEYWFCPDCEGFWQDEALTQLTNSKNVIVAATGSENLVHFEAVEPGCHQNGNIEYWFCADCEAYYQDEACTQLTNSKRVILPALGGEVVHFEAIEAGCHYVGNIEYWFCAECEGFWADEALTQVTNSKNVNLPALGGDVIHFEAVKPGCHYNGNIEYWFCADCEQFWQNAELTQLTNSKNVVLPATGAELKHVAAVAPTATENGNVEYWYCAECEQYFLDEACTKITNALSVVLPATGSEIVPPTGDSIMTVVVIAMISAMACVVVLSKKKVF